jgi:hypothetical protein
MMDTAGKETDKATEALGKMLKDFGKSISEILKDPELREKAEDFAKAAVEATARVAEKKIEREDVKDKLRKVGSAARLLGEELEKHFDQKYSA